jgi:hypothetical protein
MTFDCLARLTLFACLASPIACTTWVDADPSCPRGEQRIDGHCLPTPSIVFQRCMEAVRTRSIEHDRGRDLAVSASAQARGGSIQHERRDLERREYDGLATDDLSVAIGECRRQEEAERAGQIARAWEDAERARTDAESARLEAVTAKGELRRATARLEKLEGARDEAARNDARPFGDLPAVDDAALHDEAPNDEAPNDASSWSDHDSVDAGAE